MISEHDKDWVIQEIDPDWKDHFLTIEQAFEFYWKYSSKEILEVIKRDAA